MGAGRTGINLLGCLLAGNGNKLNPVPLKKITEPRIMQEA
jgi:hypothetical protein